MSEPFVGEIRMFGGNFAPRGWALCDGQLLSVSQNDALFALLGTIYGGDGRTTFALPDLRGRLALSEGRGPGLTTRTQGARGGSETETVAAANLPPHNHALNSGDTANVDFAGGHYPGNTGDDHGYSLSGDLDVQMGANTGPAGTATPQSHNNVMPFLCVNYIIALNGIFPSRS